MASSMFNSVLNSKKMRKEICREIIFSAMNEIKKTTDKLKMVSDDVHSKLERLYDLCDPTKDTESDIQELSLLHSSSLCKSFTNFIGDAVKTDFNCQQTPKRFYVNLHIVLGNWITWFVCSLLDQGKSKRELPKDYKLFEEAFVDILQSTRIILKQARLKDDRTHERNHLISSISSTLQRMHIRSYHGEELWNYCHTISPRVVDFLQPSECFDAQLDLGYCVTVDVPWEDAASYVDCFVEHVDERRKEQIFSSNIIRRECFSVSGVFAINWPSTDCSLQMKIPIVVDEELEHTVFFAVVNTGERWEKIHASRSSGGIHNLLQAKYLDFKASKMSEFYAISDYKETITKASPKTGLDFTTTTSPGLSVKIDPQFVNNEVEMNFKTVPVLKASKKMLKLLKNQPNGAVVKDISDTLIVSYSDNNTPSLPAKVSLPFNQGDDDDDLASDDEGETVLTRCDDDVEILDSDFVEPNGDRTVHLKHGRYQLLKVGRNWKQHESEIKDTVLRLLQRTTDCKMCLTLMKVDPNDVIIMQVDVTQVKVQSEANKSEPNEASIYKSSTVILLQEKDKLSVDCSGMFALQDRQSQTTLMFIRNAKNRLLFNVSCSRQEAGSITVSNRGKPLHTFKISRQTIAASLKPDMVVLDSESRTSSFQKIEDIKKKFQNISQEAKDKRQEILRPKTGGENKTASQNVPEKLPFDRLKGHPTPCSNDGDLADTTSVSTVTSIIKSEEVIIHVPVPMTTDVMAMPISDESNERKSDGKWVNLEDENPTEDIENIKDAILAEELENIKDAILTEKLEKIKDERELIKEQIKLAKLQQHHAILKIKQITPSFDTDEEF